MVPLLLVAGFLGSGKTHAALRLAQALSARGILTQLLQYDVGEGALGRTWRESGAELTRYGVAGASAGTPCGSVHEVLHLLRHASTQPDSVVGIEVTGASTTDDLLAHLTTDQRLERFTLPLQLTVVDAPRWQTRGVHNELERAQVSTATHVLLNWAEQLKPGEEDTIKAAIRDLNPQATVATEESLAEWLHNLVQQVRQTANRAAVPVNAKPRQEVAHLRTPPFGMAAIQVPASVDRESFEEFINTLPDSVVRAKGRVRFADTPTSVVAWNKLPGHSEVQCEVQLENSPSQPDERPAAVFVGVDLPVRELAEGLSALAPKDKK